jgi:RNA polymerase sigma factor (sigma-70 family)
MGDDSASSHDLTLGRDVFMSRVDGMLDPAYRLATIILLDHEAAEDAVHDATMRAWNQYRRVRGDVTSFRTWYLSIIAAECRRRRLWRLLPLRQRADDESDEPGSLSGVFGGLPLASRVALFCYVSLDLPLDEVARVLRTSHARVRARVYRATERVQAELADKEDEEEAHP